MNIPLNIFFLLLVATAFLVGCASTAWSRSRDPLHPVLWFSALFFVCLVVEPFMCLRHPDFVRFFPDFRGVWTATTIQYAGMVSLFLGMLSVRGPRFRASEGQRLDLLAISDAQRLRLRQFALVLASLALAAYWYAIFDSGGFFHVYSRGKGTFRTFSGYQGEAVNLCLVATVLYALSVQGKTLTISHVIAILVIVNPVLLHGTFGGRRGPLFLAMTTIFFAWHLIRGRLPSVRLILLFAMCCLLAVVFIHSQRRIVYLGSDQTFDLERFWSGLRNEELTAGDNFVVSTGQIHVTLETGNYNFGRTFLTHFIIRPIPRQLWPTKYEDTQRLLYGGGAAEQAFQEAVPFQSWRRVLGWQPLPGFSINSIVELFVAFSWPFLIFCWLLGYGVSCLWVNFRCRGQLWVPIYAITMALSIYLPTQTFTAFAHRWLYITVFTLLLSRFIFRTEPKRKPRRSLLPPPRFSHPVSEKQSQPHASQVHDSAGKQQVR